MLAAAYAHEALGRDAQAARDLGEIVVSATNWRDDTRFVSVAGQFHRIGARHWVTRRRRVRYRGNLTLRVDNAETAGRTFTAGPATHGIETHPNRQDEYDHEAPQPLRRTGA